MLMTLWVWFLRLKYREGRTLSRFIAIDVRRDILVLSNGRIREGIITGRVRTNNMLYVHKGYCGLTDFGPIEELRLSDLWRWTGQPWGGLPDGTSLIARSLKRNSDKQGQRTADDPLPNDAPPGKTPTKL